MKTFSSKNIQCEVKTVSLTFAIYCLTLESELVLFLHLISPHGWGIVWISSYYCLWYLMLIQLSLSRFCAHTWYLLVAGVLFWYNVSGIWCQYSWAWVGFVLMPDISLQLGYCFDIICLWYLMLISIFIYHYSISSFFHFFYWHNTYIIISNLMKEHVLHG